MEGRTSLGIVTETVNKELLSLNVSTIVLKRAVLLLLITTGTDSDHREKPVIAVL